MAYQQLLRIDDVISRTGLSRSTIYRMMNDGEFPRSRRVGRQSVVWLETDIAEWIESLPESDPNDWHSPNRQ